MFSTESPENHLAASVEKYIEKNNKDDGINLENYYWYPSFPNLCNFSLSWDIKTKSKKERKKERKNVHRSAAILFIHLFLWPIFQKDVLYSRSPNFPC